MGNKGSHTHTIEKVVDQTQLNLMREQMKQNSQEMKALRQQQDAERKEAAEEARLRDERYMKMITQQMKMSSQEKQRIEAKMQEDIKRTQAQNAKTMELISAQIEALKQQNLKLMQREPQIIVQPDPELQKKVDQMDKQNKELMNQLKSFKNPELMKQAHQQQINNYIKFLSTKNFEQSLENTMGIQHNILVGQISSAKTSTLNYFYGLSLKTGVDEVTTKAEPVVKGSQVVIWDSPGLNEKFDLMCIETLKLFATAHRIFIMFQKSLKCIKDDVRILTTVKKCQNVYCVRTMCDKFDDQEDLNKAIQTDYKVLASWDIKGVPVFATSNMKNMGFMDNQKVKDLMDS